MPDHYYYRLDAGKGSSVWDFSQWTPDIVVVNLGQNDKWLGTTEAQAVQGYIDFVHGIQYRDPHHTCLGKYGCHPGRTPWPGYIGTAVAALQQSPYNDSNVHQVIFLMMAWERILTPRNMRRWRHN